MKKLLILLFLPFNLFSDSITFDELEKKALEHSFHLQELIENIKMDENLLKELQYPGLLNIQSTINPTYSFGTYTGYENELNKGSLVLSFTPYHSVSLTSTYTEDLTSFDISYSPLSSNRDIKSKKNKIEINKIKFVEQRKDFNKQLKITYMSLYFLRENIKLTQNYLEMLNKKITQEENKLDKGVGDSETLYNNFDKLLETETSFYNLEIDILDLESEIFKLSGTNIEGLKMEPLLTNFNLEEDVIIKTVDEYKSESEFLSINEQIRDQRVAIKDTQKAILPNFTISSGVDTKDFSDYVGRVSLLATLSMDFNYLTKIENQKLILNRFERTKIQKIKEYQQKIENSKRKVDINQNRIDSLSKSLERSNKNLKAQKFLLDKGEILLEDYNIIEIKNKQLILDLEQAKTLFILEYLTKY